jgi:hypothetical protein
MKQNKKKLFFRLTPFSLLLHGLIILPSFLLQENLLVRVIQAAIFLTLSLFVNKKRHILFSIITFTSIVFFHLFTPHGELIYRLYFLRITSGSLETGIFKGATFIGLLSLSKIMIMKNLTIMTPGGPFSRLSAIIGKVFYYFEALKNAGERHKDKDVIRRIDMILMDVSTQTNTDEHPDRRTKERINKAGMTLITISILFHWGLFVVSYYL